MKALLGSRAFKDERGGMCAKGARVVLLCGLEARLVGRSRGR